MATNLMEIRLILRKTEFPYCAREALIKIGDIYSSTNMSPQVLDLISDLVSEFVFLEIDRRGVRRKNALNSVQELQLLETLSYHFSDTFGNNVIPEQRLLSNQVRDNLFMALFPPAHEDRSRLLVKMVSLAISTRNIPVLVCTGIWMQYFGAHNVCSMLLADRLVKDYFVLVPKALSGLQELPSYAQQFTANFVTSVASIYGVVDNKYTYSPIPDSVLEVITGWITADPSLCVAALKSKLTGYVVGTNSVPAVAPYVGLFKWCILSPIYDFNSVNKDFRWRNFSELHLALLESLGHHAPELAMQREVIMDAGYLAFVIEPILYKYSEQKVMTDRMELALDRLAQVIEIGFENDCIQGNKEHLLKELEILPEHRLLQMVIRKQKKSLMDPKNFGPSTSSMPHRLTVVPSEFPR